MSITPHEGRVLGCLVEKQLTTPQQYPLTANALSLACSQSTNRDPVVAMTEDAVLDTLNGLREQRLVRFVLPSHGRSVVRYRHVLDEVYGLDAPRLALVAVLLLRGPQTPGELRARTGRMAEFPEVQSVQAELDVLAAHPDGLVELLPRRPGQKEDRWQQLLAAPWDAWDGGGEAGLVGESSGARDIGVGLVTAPPSLTPGASDAAGMPGGGAGTGEGEGVGAGAGEGEGAWGADLGSIRGADPGRPGPGPGPGPGHAGAAGAGPGGSTRGLDADGDLHAELADLRRDVTALQAAVAGLTTALEDLRESLGG